MLKRGYKICPYCAEEIKEAAIICRYCGRDLQEENVHRDKPSRDNKKQNKSPKVFTLNQEIAEPSTALSWMFVAGLVLSFWAISFVSLIFFSDPYAIEDFAGLLTLAAKIAIAYLGANGFSKEKPNFIHYLVVFILALLPLLNYFPLFYSGKYLAKMYLRRRSSQG